MSQLRLTGNAILLTLILSTFIYFDGGGTL